MTVKYRIFDVELGGYEEQPSGNVRFSVRVTRTPRDQVQSDGQADRVEIPGGMASALEPLARRWAADVDPSTFAGACNAIGGWLFPRNSGARSLLQGTLDSLRPDEALYLRLRCRDDRLARVPWEFAAHLFESHDDDSFHVNRMLASNSRICITRYEELAMGVGSASRTGGPARLLFVTAAPSTLPQLKLHLERRSIETVFERCTPSPSTQWLERATTRSLTDLLARDRFDVVQFSGHGGYDDRGFLQLEPENGGSGRLSSDALAMLLGQKGVSVVVLAACVTGEIELELPWSGVARALVEAGVPAVVGMQSNIGDDSAIAFISAFYRALVQGRSLGDAVIEGRQAICVDQGTERDFGVPVLYLRGNDQWNTIVFPEIPAKRASRLEARIRSADAYKRMHDALHTKKIEVYRFMLGFVGRFPPELDRDKQALGHYANALKRCLELLNSIAAEGHTEPEIIDPMLEAFAEAIAEFEASLLDWNREAFENAILRLTPIFAREMSKLDVSLHAKIAELPPPAEITAMLAVDPVLYRELGRMIENIRELVARHHVCQRFEDLLDELATREITARTLLRNWQAVSRQLEMMIKEMDPDAANSLKNRSTLLHDILNADDDVRVSNAYDTFCGEFAMSFWKIDNNLRGLCQRLREDPRIARFELP